MKSTSKKIKDNNQGIKVEVECQNIVGVEEALESGADILMLDNMSFPDMQRAVSLIRKYKQNKPSPTSATDPLAGGDEDRDERFSSGSIHFLKPSFSASLTLVFIWETPLTSPARPISPTNSVLEGSDLFFREEIIAKITGKSVPVSSILMPPTTLMNRSCL